MRPGRLGTSRRMPDLEPRHPRAAPDLDDVPAEEGISTADVKDRLGREPEQQENATDPQEIARRTEPEDS